ncbi:MAG: flagellar hook-associated protein FlgL [Sandaracinaceae bacterium]
MRVSDSMMNDLIHRGVDNAKSEMFEAQRVASTGMRVEKPSDDPIAASRSRAMASRERRAEAVAKQSAEGLDSMRAVDGVLSEAVGVVSRARDIAVQGANETFSTDDRVAMASEVRALRSQLLSLANTEIEGEYVFAGLATDRVPFAPDGAFLGDTGLREIEVGPGLRVSTQVSGAEIFTATGGIDTFGVLESVADALEGDDPDAVSGLLVDLGHVVSQISEGRASSGVAQQGLMQAESVATRAQDEANRARVATVSADPVEAFTELVRAEGALREAIAMASRMPPPSMLEG